jgi:transketolase
MPPDELLHALEDVAPRLRIWSIRATTAAGSGHPTSAASAADLVAALFFDAMRFDPAEPRAPLNDRFVLSKGHAAPLLYAAWAEAGLLRHDELLRLRSVDSDLEGHPTPRLPFVDVATGSLGQGLSAGVGLALGARLERTDARTWVLLGDGEMAEGSVALDGDVKNSTYAERFQRAYPERFIEAYIAEQNMVGAATGLAARGFIPFVSTFACFFTRAADQIRMAGISRSNVKYCGSHAGVSIGEDGPSQMGLEDLALFCAVPDAVVLYPADAVATEACVALAAEHTGPVYIRTTRPKTKVVYPGEHRFTIGGLTVLRASEHDRVAIVAAGITLHEALAAHEELAADGLAVRVIDLYGVTPRAAATLRSAGATAGNEIVTIEDHYAEGGLGDAVTQAVADVGIVVHRLAVREIPHSGPGPMLLERYGIGRRVLVQRIREILREKRAAAA